MPRGRRSTFVIVRPHGRRRLRPSTGRTPPGRLAASARASVAAVSRGQRGLVWHETQRLQIHSRLGFARLDLPGVLVAAWVDRRRQHRQVRIGEDLAPDERAKPLPTGSATWAHRWKPRLVRTINNDGRPDEAAEHLNISTGSASFFASDRRRRPYRCVRQG